MNYSCHSPDTGNGFRNRCSPGSDVAITIAIIFLEILISATAIAITAVLAVLVSIAVWRKTPDIVLVSSVRISSCVLLGPVVIPVRATWLSGIERFLLLIFFFRRSLFFLYSRFFFFRLPCVLLQHTVDQLILLQAGNML